MVEDNKITIEYRDASSQPSRRLVTMKEIHDRSGNIIVECYDHSVKAARSFRMDRIVCVITEHGEILTAKEFFDPIIANGIRSSENNQPQKLASNEGNGTPSQVGKAAFWCLILLALAVSYFGWRDTGDLSLGIFIFAVLALPMFFVRAMWRWIKTTFKRGTKE